MFFLLLPTVSFKRDENAEDWMLPQYLGFGGSPSLFTVTDLGDFLLAHIAI